MISFQQETLYGIVEEVQSLLEMHYTELTRHKESIKLKPMWDKYRGLEQLDMFRVYTARHDSQLVGYSAFFINQHLHYEDTVVGSNDVLFLHPEFRQGTTGIKLIKFSETKLIQHGVNKIVWHCKDNGLDVILKRLGYGQEEIIMGKII